MPLFNPSTNSPAVVTKVVANSGGDYTTLGDAALAALDGWTILIQPGTTTVETGDVNFTQQNLSIIGYGPTSSVIGMGAFNLTFDGASNLVDGVGITLTSGHISTSVDATYFQFANSQVTKTSTAPTVVNAANNSRWVNNFFDESHSFSGAATHFQMAGTNLLFQNNTCSYGNTAAILLEFTAAVVSVIGNSVFNVGGQWAGNYLLSFPSSSLENAITGNFINGANTDNVGASNKGIKLHCAKNNVVGNTFINIGTSIDVDGTNNTITGNSFITDLGTTTGYPLGVVLSNVSNDCVISGNTFYGQPNASTIGIVVNSGADNTVISGNRISNYDVPVSITGPASNNTVLIGNNLEGNTNPYNDAGTGTITGGGGGTPGGSDTQVQVNNSGAFGGSSGFLFDKVSHIALGTGSAINGAITNFTSSKNIITAAETFTDFTTDLTAMGAGVALNVNPTVDEASGVGVGLGWASTTDVTSDKNFGILAGTFGNVIHHGSGALGLATGVFGAVTKDGSGTIALAQGGDFQAANGADSRGVVAQATGVGGGVAYGVYITPTAGADTNYELYAPGTGGNLLAGHTAIGGTATVDGDIPGFSTTSKQALTIEETYTDLTTDNYGIGLSTAVIMNSSADAPGALGFGHAYSVITDPASTTSLGFLSGVYGNVVHKGSGALGNAIGMGAFVNTESGTIGLSIGGKFDARAGAVTKGLDVYATGIGGGTAYGIYINGISGADTNYDLYVASNNASYFAGTIGVQTLVPTAALHLPAAQDGAGLAPLKMTSGGTLMSTPEDGAIEFTDHLYVTVGSTRYQLDQQTAGMAASLFDHYVDANNTTTTETDLYSDSLAANTFNANGDKVSAQYGGIFTGAATSTQNLKAYLGGTLIFDTGALAIGAITADWDMKVTCIRVSSSVVRCSVTLTTSFASLSSYSNYQEVTGLTLTNTQILKITGTAAGIAAASNQITAKEGYVEFKPAA